MAARTKSPAAPQPVATITLERLEASDVWGTCYSAVRSKDMRPAHQHSGSPARELRSGTAALLAAMDECRAAAAPAVSYDVTVRLTHAQTVALLDLMDHHEARTGFKLPVRVAATEKLRAAAADPTLYALPVAA